MAHSDRARTDWRALDRVYTAIGQIPEGSIFGHSRIDLHDFTGVLDRPVRRRVNTREGMEVAVHGLAAAVAIYPGEVLQASHGQAKSSPYAFDPEEADDHPGRAAEPANRQTGQLSYAEEKICRSVNFPIRLMPVPTRQGKEPCLARLGGSLCEEVLPPQPGRSRRRPPRSRRDRGALVIEFDAWRYTPMHLMLAPRQHEQIEEADVGLDSRPSAYLDSSDATRLEGTRIDDDPGPSHIAPDFREACVPLDLPTGQRCPTESVDDRSRLRENVKCLWHGPSQRLTARAKGRRLRRARAGFMPTGGN